jgi:hypothetical protein
MWYEYREKEYWNSNPCGDTAPLGHGNCPCSSPFLICPPMPVLFILSCLSLDSSHSQSTSSTVEELGFGFWQGQESFLYGINFHFERASVFDARKRNADGTEQMTEWRMRTTAKSNPASSVFLAPSPLRHVATVLRNFICLQ